jgi:hypothetical protein
VPSIVEMKKSTNKELRRLVRKFDPAVRDERNRRLGKAGEEFVVGVERERLRAAERSDFGGEGALGGGGRWGRGWV